MIRETRKGEILMIADVNLFIHDNLANLIKERSEPKLMIGYIYKFKVSKLIEVCIESPIPAKTLTLRLRITPYLKSYLNNIFKVLRNYI